MVRIISLPHRDIAPVRSLSRPIGTWHRSLPQIQVSRGGVWTDLCVDSGAIDQRNDGADTRDRHQAPAHVVVPHDGQQAAVQDAELFAQHPADNEQWFNQHSQVGQVLDQLLDARLNPGCPHYADLETEVAVGLLICAFNTARMCRVSTQITGKPGSARTCNDARGMAQMMRVGLYRPLHVKMKMLRSQKLRMLLTHRKLLQSKAIAIDNDLRGTLPGEAFPSSRGSRS